MHFQIEGEKALSRSLKCYPSLCPTPQGTAARFGVARSGLENLRNFRALLVFKAKYL